MFFLSGTMKFLTIFTLALVTVSANGLYFRSIEVSGFENEGRITNGKNAAPGQFKYQVGLVLKDTFCSGSLIGKTWVLTAAICTYGASSVMVYLGTTNFKVPEKVHNVSKSDIITHSGFHPDKFVDNIALTRIPETSENNRIGIVRIPRHNINKYIGESVVVTGWGLTSDTSDELPVDLKYGLLKVSPGSVCSKAYAPDFTDALFICAATPNKVSPCNGDSGGPMVVERKNLQIGLIAFGSSDGCAIGCPAAFTRVSAYLPWICSHTKIAC